MTRFRTILAVAATFASILVVPSPSQARTLDIEVFSTVISPRQLVAAKGDQLRFNVTDGHHDIISYKSADFDNDPATAPTLIQSGDVRALRNGTPVVFTTGFTGGTVWYRCQLHSFFDSANEICSGMCASITDRTTIPLPPTITVPSGPIQERPASISGTADPLTIVELAEGPSVEVGQYRGQAMTNEYGEWTVKTVDFGTVGGNRQLIARSVDARGYVSDDSASVVVLYQPDRTIPRLTWDPVPLAVFAQTLSFSGTATDNVKVRGVKLRFTYVNPNTSNAQDTQDIVEVATECAGCQTSGSVTWSFEGSVKGILGDLGGVYRVDAIAIDTSELTVTVGVPTLLSLVIQVGGPVELPEELGTMAPSPIPLPTQATLPPTP